VRRAPKLGGGPIETMGTIDDARELVISRNELYVATSASGIFRMNTADFSATKLVDGRCEQLTVRPDGSVYGVVAFDPPAGPPPTFGVYRMDAPAVELFSIPSDQYPYGIAVDDTHVYYTALGDSSVQRAALDGGQPGILETVAGASPRILTVAPDFVYGRPRPACSSARSSRKVSRACSTDPRSSARSSSTDRWFMPRSSREAPSMRSTSVRPHPGRLRAISSSPSGSLKTAPLSTSEKTHRRRAPTVASGARWRAVARGGAR
jgi:hypothetical protein